MKGFLLRTLAVCFIFALLGGAAQAQVTACQITTDTLGATIITWESHFDYPDYTLGNSIMMTVSWTVDEGVATYDYAMLRHYTPKSKKDPAVGDDPIFTYPGSAGENSVDITFSFSELHTCEERAVEIGNGHFTILLKVDEDGDGETDSTAGFGTNIHVEDPE